MKTMAKYILFFLILLAGQLYAEIAPAGAPVHKVGGDWIMRDWLLIGPFKNTTIKGSKNRDVHVAFRKDFIKSLGGEGKAVLKPSSKIRYKDANGKTNAMKAQQVSAYREGVVNIDRLYGRENASAYAFCYIYAEEDMPFMFYFSGDNSAKVWINGQLVHSVIRNSRIYPHSDNFIVHLKRGYNPVLVKVFNYPGAIWEFIMEGNRIDTISEMKVDADGVPIHSFGDGDFVRNWLVVGGFENEEVKDRLADGSKFKGFGTDYLKSLGGEAKAKLTEKTVIAFADRMERGRVYLPTKTKASSASARLDGQVDLIKYFDDTDYRCGYAFCYIESDKARTVRFYLGANDLAKVWVNGNPVAKKLNTGVSRVRDMAFEVRLREGLNPVLVKVCNHTGGWGFVLEALTSEGQ